MATERSAAAPPSVHLCEITPPRPPEDAAATLPPGQFPHPLTSLVGRDADIAAVRALLMEGEVRLLTLTGPGGVGKTRLALAAAAAVAAEFPDGASFVPLAALSDARKVLPAIARSLGIQESRNRPLSDVLAAALQGKRRLVVLDNFEHVLAAAADVVHLLEACPGLTALVTSRAPLRASGERRYLTPALAVPDPAHGSGLDALQSFAAMALFVERARRVDPDFALDEQNAGAVAEICRRLDGLPLAIELAAAWTHVLPPAALLARLEPSLSMLHRESPDQPARLRTMRSAIAWSYALLSDDEARLLRRLAGFVDGFTLEAAESIGGSEGPGEGAARRRSPSPSSVLDLLTALVDKSLLQTRPGSPDARFMMLETIREFALERLADSGEEPAVRAAHAAAMADLAARAEPHLLGPDERRWEA